MPASKRLEDNGKWQMAKLEHAAGAGSAYTLCAEIVLDPQRDAGQWRKVLSGSASLIDAVGVCTGSLGGDLQKGMHAGVDRVNPGQVMVGELPRGHLPVRQLLTPFGDRHGQDLRAAETLSARCVLNAALIPRIQS